MTAWATTAVEVICDYRRCTADVALVNAELDDTEELLAPLGWSFVNHPRDGWLHYCPDHTIPDTGDLTE